MLPWIWITVIILSALPWALYFRLGSDDNKSNALTICLSLTFSLGSISLIMLTLGILGVTLRFWLISILYLFIMNLGWIFAWRNKGDIALKNSWPFGFIRRSIWIICFVIAAAQIINASYWPFFREDTLGIYAPFASTIYESQTLITLEGLTDLYNRYESYPMMMPLIYAYTYMSSNQVQEFLAKTVSTLLALATIPAAYLLGKSAHSKEVGWLSAVLLALTPAFWRWASSGYVDLPMALFTTLSAYFALRLWKKGEVNDAFLTGLHIGLATWVKNAGLVLYPIILLWCILGFRFGKIKLLHFLFLVLTSIISGSIWYLWTFWQAGIVIPNTAWTDQAQHTVSSFFVFIFQWKNYSIVGWLVIFGIAIGIKELFNSGLKKPENFILLVWFVPFWLVWWWFVSYDSRFILLILPLACVLGASSIMFIYGFIEIRFRNFFSAVVLICAAIWAIHGVFVSIQFKDEIISDPFKSKIEKISIVRP